MMTINMKSLSCTVVDVECTHCHWVIHCNVWVKFEFNDDNLVGIYVLSDHILSPNNYVYYVDQ